MFRFGAKKRKEGSLNPPRLLGTGIYRFLSTLARCSGKFRAASFQGASRAPEASRETSQ